MSVSISPSTVGLAIGSYQDFTLSGKVGTDYFFDVVEGADKCTVSKQSSNVWRVTRTASGTIRVRGSENPYYDGSRASGNNDGTTILNEDGSLEVISGHGYGGYNFNAVLTGSGDYFEIQCLEGLRVYCGDSSVGVGSVGAIIDVNNSAYTQFNNKLKFLRNGGNLEYYKDNVLIDTFAITTGHTHYLGFQVTGGVGVGTQLRPEISGSYTGNYTQAIAQIINPLDADFTAPSTINYGSTLSISDAVTGGSGTKVRVWKIDGITVTPANGNYVNPTFTGLSVGNHTIRLEVSDDSGSDYAEKTVTVVSITGSSSINHGATNGYSTDVPSPTWSIVSGGGSINSSTGALTAPGSGSGLITIKAAKSDDPTIYATKVVELNTRITTTSPLSGVIGFSASGSFAADGGVGSGTFSKVSGTYPTGISVGSDGVRSGTFTAIGTFSFRLRYVDSSNPSNTVEKDFVWDVTSIIVPASVWSRMGMMPTRNALFWNALDNETDATVIGDYSGNDNKLEAVSSAPVLQPNIINDKPAVYFDGTKNPLKFTKDLTLKHLFLIAKFDGATFTGNEGLFSGVASGSILRGNGSGQTKFENLSIGSGYVYKKNFITLSEATENAPMNAFAIIELIFPSGKALDGVQIGQDTSNTGRKWKGWFVEQIGYGEVQDDCATKAIYEYFALKFWLWRYKSDNYPYFPFVFNRSSKHRSTELAEISEAEGLRGSDRVVRYLDDAPLHSYDLEFNYRFYLEYLATVQFLNERRLHLPFWIEDIERTFERRMTRTTELTDNGYGSAYKFDYNFGVKDY